MPLVEITLTEGRSPTQVRGLLHAVHRAVEENTAARPDHIRVIVREVPRTHWATGDVTVAELLPDPVPADQEPDVEGVRRPEEAP